MAASDKISVRSKIPSRRGNADPGDMDWDTPTVNGMPDGDMLDLMRKVLDKVLKNQTQLNAMEKKMDTVQDQMSELNRKLDMIATKVLGNTEYRPAERPSDAFVIVTGGTTEKDSDGGETESKMIDTLNDAGYGSGKNKLSIESARSFSGSSSARNSLETEVKLKETVSEYDSDVTVPKRTGDLSSAYSLSISKKSSSSAEGDLNDVQTIDEDHRSFDNSTRPSEEAGENTIDEPVSVGASNSRAAASVRAEIDRENTSVPKPSRKTGLNFGHGRFQKRTTSPPPVSSNKKTVQYSQFKRQKTELSADNRKTYLQDSFSIVHGNQDIKPDSIRASAVDMDRVDSVDEGSVANNQKTAPSGFKNEHGDEDNRFMSAAHEDLKNSSFHHRSQSLTNLQRVREGSKRTSAAQGAPTGAEQSDQKTEHTSEDMVHDDVLHSLIEKERIAAANCEDMKSDGVDTVICLDTSASMAGKPLTKAIETIVKLLEGLETNAIEHDLEENVALVTFGKENTIVSHLTNDYGSIRDKLETISAGGPSPLWLGLALALTEIKERGGSCVMESLSVMPRIIVITDGFATSKNQLSGTDLSRLDEAASRQVLTLYQMCKTISSSVDCIVLGPCNEELLRVLSDGRVFTPEDMKYLIEFFRAREFVSQCLGKIADGQLNRAYLDTTVDNTKFTKKGKEDMLRLLKETPTEPGSLGAGPKDSEASKESAGVGVKKDLEQSRYSDLVDEEKMVEQPKPKPRPRTQTDLNKLRPDTQTEPDKPRSDGQSNPDQVRAETQSESETETVANESDLLQPTSIDSQVAIDELEETDIPGFGTLVVADPEWEGYHSRQNVIGTVIGARKNGYIKVLWSDGSVEKRKYGVNGQYEIKATTQDADTDVDNGHLRIGSLVERGKDWRWKDQDGGVGNIGVVLKIDGAVIHVIWPHGGQGNYRFGYNKKYDLKICGRVKPETLRKYYAWHIQDHSQDWHILHKEPNDCFEQMYNTKQPGTFLVTIHSKEFRISFQNMTARDKTDNSVHPIERREISEEEWLALKSEQ